MELSQFDQDKLNALLDLPFTRAAEIVAIYFPAPDGTHYYASRPYDLLPEFSALPLTPLEPKLVLNQSSPMLELARTSSVADDSVDLALADLDSEFTRLFYVHGEGVPMEVFGYFPQVDLLMSMWRGACRTPKDAEEDIFKIKATIGFRSPQMLLPRRLLSTPNCPLMFGGLRSDIAHVLLGRCRYDLHLGGTEGVVNPATGEPWTDCARDSRATCTAHFGHDFYYGGGGVLVESVANNQTKGPNLLATTIGNTNNLADPVRVLFGQRLLKGLRVIAFAPEPDTKHPDKGWLKALLEVGEGPFNSIWQARIMNVLVGYEHLNIRTGTLKQPRTGFSPQIGNYSGTGLIFGRIQGNYNNVSAGDVTGSCWAQGINDVRVYSTQEDYTEQYSSNRAWCILRMMSDQTWGYGEDYQRSDLMSFKDAANWTEENVVMVDPNGNVFSEQRSTFNAELTARATAQQLSDACVSGRLGIPFEHNGKTVLVPLRKEVIDDDVIPYFTDVIADPDHRLTIMRKNGKSTLTRSVEPDSTLVNQWTVSFDDASQEYTSVPLVIGDQRQQLRAGEAWGDSSIRIINKAQAAFGVTSFSEAVRLGNWLLYLGPNDSGGLANNLSIKFTTWYTYAANVRNYKLIKVVSPKIAIYGFEYFRVMKTVRKSDLTVEITAQAYPVDFYDIMEHVSNPAPIIVGGPTANPGGGVHAVPCDAAFAALQHYRDHVDFLLQEC